MKTLAEAGYRGKFSFEYVYERFLGKLPLKWLKLANEVRNYLIIMFDVFEKQKFPELLRYTKTAPGISYSIPRRFKPCRYRSSALEYPRDEQDASPDSGSSS